MNGATALPWASSSRPPITRMTTMTGIIQNFLRILRKLQSSFRNDIRTHLSELPRHGFRSGSGRIPRKPVRGYIRREAQAQGVLPKHPKQERQRSYYQQEYRAH